MDGKKQNILMTSFSMRRSRIAFVGAAFASDLEMGVSISVDIPDERAHHFERCASSSLSFVVQI